jgi:hypothetical protein
VRSEAYLYGSARLGLDTEEQVIGDSLEKYKAVYNPLCHAGNINILMIFPYP